jgi:hypothetical protein
MNQTGSKCPTGNSACLRGLREFSSPATRVTNSYSLLLRVRARVPICVIPSVLAIRVTGIEVADDRSIQGIQKVMGQGFSLLHVG